MSVGLPVKRCRYKHQVPEGLRRSARRARFRRREVYACGSPFGEDLHKNIQATETLLSAETLEHCVQDCIDCQFDCVIFDIAIA